MTDAPFPYDHNGPPIEADETKPGDWIALSRRVREHPIVGCGQPVKPDDPWRGAYSRFEAWFDLLCLAQYRPSRVNNKGEVMTLEVGQLMGARRYLSDRWNWSEKTVRGYLDTLESEGMIERSTPDRIGGPSVAPRWPSEQASSEKGQQKGQQRTNKSSVISICNYSKYQQMSEAIDAYIRQTRGPAKGQQRATEGPPKGQNLTLTPSTIEQVDTLSDQADRTPPQPKPKKIKSRPARVYAERFEEFWRAYPDRTNNSKPAAAEEFDRLDAQSQADAIRSLPAFAAYCQANTDYRCIHAERYLKQRRFDGFAEKAEPTKEAWWKDPEKVRQITDDQWRGSIAKHANGMWPPDRLGPAPGSPRCVVPKHIIDELKLTERYTPNGISREKH
jgi:hypothetical protein